MFLYFYKKNIKKFFLHLFFILFKRYFCDFLNRKSARRNTHILWSPSGTNFG